MGNKIKTAFELTDNQSTICELEKVIGKKISLFEITDALKSGIIRNYNRVECNVCGRNEMAYELIELEVDI